MLQRIERRLDNVVFRLGLAKSRNHARQMVTHGGVQVNGKKLDIPSYSVRPGEQVSLKPTMYDNPQVMEALEAVKPEDLPIWLKRIDKVGNIEKIPTREEIITPIDEQLIVEFYSR